MTTSDFVLEAKIELHNGVPCPICGTPDRPPITTAYVYEKFGGLDKSEIRLHPDDISEIQRLDSYGGPSFWASATRGPLTLLGRPLIPDPAQLPLMSITAGIGR